LLNYFPKYLTDKAFLLYFVALSAISLAFFSHAMPIHWYLFGIVDILLFFHFSNTLTKQWFTLSPQAYTKKLFTWGFVLSVLFMAISYITFSWLRGEPFEYDPSDGLAYHQGAAWFADEFWKGDTSNYWGWFVKEPLSDQGYPLYLALIYPLLGSEVFLVRVVKCVYRAWMGVLVYKLAARTFGESVGRMAGIFCLFMPNITFYAGSHRKEMEMIFLTVWAIERFDALLRGQQFKLKNIILPIFLVIILFTFRTALGAAIMIAFLVTLMLSKVASKRRKRKILVWSFALSLVIAGGPIYGELSELWNRKFSGEYTGKTVEWRAETEGGNKFAKYAGSAVFAPLIVVIPFPTMVDPQVEAHYNFQRMNGGYFIRNFLAFFVLLALFKDIKSKKWRNYIFIYAFMFGYLGIIAFSEFAQSERFHLPAVPFLLILAAHGISEFTNKDKRAFSIYMVLLFVALIGWNWFKLAGRGLI